MGLMMTARCGLVGSFMCCSRTGE